MLYSFSDLQPLIDSYLLSLNFISTELIQEWKTIKLLMKITYRWLNSVHAQQFIDFIRLDIIIHYSSLFFTDLNQTYWGWYHHRPLTLDPKITEDINRMLIWYYQPNEFLYIYCMLDIFFFFLEKCTSDLENFKFLNDQMQFFYKFNFTSITKEY